MHERRKRPSKTPAEHDAAVLTRLRGYAYVGLPVPSNAVLASEIGCCEWNLDHAIERLHDDGRVVLERRGRLRVVVEIEQMECV